MNMLVLFWWMMACSRPPDVLVVVMDTVRADHLSAYGYERDTSPFLSEFSENGVIFADTTSPGSWTWPAHASLFTGLYPWEHGARLSDDGKQLTRVLTANSMRTDVPTLAEQLSAKGYRTVSVSTNHLLSEDLGLTRGFGSSQVFSEDGQTVKAVLSEIDADDDRPLFLFVNLMGAHIPWKVRDAPWTEGLSQKLAQPTGWLERYVTKGQVNLYANDGGASANGVELITAGRIQPSQKEWALLNALYDGEILEVDRQLGRIVRRFQGATENALIAVTSDHGEFVGEQGWAGHCFRVYPELLAVPLVVVGDDLPKGRVVQSPVQMHWLYDLVLHEAGIGKGGELMNAIKGEPTSPVMAKAWTSSRASRLLKGPFQQDWALYREKDEVFVQGSLGGQGYYRIDSDPGLSQDLSQRFPERVEILRRATEGLFEETVTTAGVEASEETVEQLRALGYVQ